MFKNLENYNATISKITMQTNSNKIDFKLLKQLRQNQY